MTEEETFDFSNQVVFVKHERVIIQEVAGLLREIPNGRKINNNLLDNIGRKNFEFFITPHDYSSHYDITYYQNITIAEAARIFFGKLISDMRIEE